MGAGTESCVTVSLWTRGGVSLFRVTEVLSGRLGEIEVSRVLSDKWARVSCCFFLGVGTGAVEVLGGNVSAVCIGVVCLGLCFFESAE